VDSHNIEKEDGMNKNLLHIEIFKVERSKEDLDHVANQEIIAESGLKINNTIYS
jgi:hypothetical protein